MEADFSACQHYAKIVAKTILSSGLPVNTLLNVNFPDLSLKKIKGIKLCRQALAKWEEEFDERKDPRGRPYFWLTGKFRNYDKGEDTDEWALENGYVSVVPVSFDFTAHHAFQFLNKMKWDV